MNNRLKEIRNTLGLSQEEFGKRIHLSKPTISALENATRSISERVVNDICREFNVNSLWLEEGKGEMFSSYSEDLIESVAEEYKLNEYDVELVRAYLELDEDSRRAIVNFIKKTRLV